jgi:transcriptional regulator with XRE-family HTH domain
MAKSVFTGSHPHLVAVLITARKRSGLTQAELAKRLGKDQTLISNIENSQRRVDVLEFYALAKALEVDPVVLFAEVVKRLPERVEF